MVSASGPLSVPLCTEVRPRYAGFQPVSPAPAGCLEQLLGSAEMVNFPEGIRLPFCLNLYYFSAGKWCYQRGQCDIPCFY